MAITLATLGAAGCSYGPEEELVRLEQIVAYPDSYLAIASVRYDRFRTPTGLNAFPDGGKALVLERRGVHYLLDGRARTVRLLLDRDAPDELWESFHSRVAALEGDSVVYLSMTGCPRGGECWGDLVGQRFHRMELAGEPVGVDRVPDGLGLPGEMLARRQGEVNFIRWSQDWDSVTVRLVDDGPFEPAFVFVDGGGLTPIAR
jgi:hypothetical protein